jgi:hypothetical protein
MNSFFTTTNRNGERKVLVLPIIAALLAATAIFTTGRQLVKDVFCFDGTRSSFALSALHLDRFDVFQGHKLDIKQIDSCNNDDLFAYSVIKTSPALTPDQLKLFESELDELPEWQSAPFAGMSEKELIEFQGTLACFSEKSDSPLVLGIMNYPDDDTLEIYVSSSEDIYGLVPCHA